MSLLSELETPALVIDRRKLDHNIGRMRERMAGLGVSIRPHVKTVKSIDIVRRSLDGQPGGITVSTLKEADYFLEHGIRDIVYAVGIAPNKIPHVVRLIERGATLTVLLDNVAIVAAVERAAAAAAVRIPVLIEIDVDDHRAGVAPDSAALLEIGRAVSDERHLELRGVLTHGGGSYDCRSVEDLQAFAERERSGAVTAAQRLRKAGMSAPVVSIGSTPTGTFARNLEDVTEVRVGVYMTQDLVMHGLHVCDIDDIALSVLVAVIGHQPEKGWIITDGGWMALSRDRGIAHQAIDYGYGLVLDAAGRRLEEDLVVNSMNQEHGIVVKREGPAVDPARYPVGTLLRVLPNHACATAAAHSVYQVVDAESPHIVATWPRFNGW